MLSRPSFSVALSKLGSAFIRATREDFLSLLAGKNSLLEIGVFDTPTLNFLYTSNASKVIHYADWFSRDELIERATVIKNAGGDRNPSEVPEIKWILSQGYSQINYAYDAVVSHHCLEHQPDLIRHFLDVRSILADGGWYFVSLPDKNFCFDHFIPDIVIHCATHYKKSHNFSDIKKINISL